MNGGVFSARVFTLMIGIGYAVAVYVDYPLFRYYPLAKRFSFDDLADRALGPAMSWYGWIATGAVAAILIAACVPRRIGDRIPGSVFWVVALIMFVAGWYREKSWFM